MSPPPVPFTWDGQVMTPKSSYRSHCLLRFNPGTWYHLTEHQERSQESHRHEFAEIDEAWKNLPERLAGQFPTSTHLRKHALIRTGWCDSRHFVASSKAEALRLAPFIRAFDEYSLVTVAGQTVTVLTALSQSRRAMGKKRFQASKDAVLAFVAELIGTSPATLAKEASDG
jgi:hypothetical protein